MKLHEMADLISNLATTLEPVLKQGGVNDLRAVSDCFRQFGEENVGAFCKFINNAKTGKSNGATRKGKASSQSDQEAVDQMVANVKHFVENQQSYDYSELRELAATIGKLKVTQIKKIGEDIHCPVFGKKSEMVAQIEDFLIGIKQGSDRAQFHPTGT